MVRIIRNAIHRANGAALRLIKMAHAFGTQRWVDLVDHGAFVYGLVWANGFADIAIDALVGDF